MSSLLAIPIRFFISRIHIEMLSGMHRTSKMRGLATDQPTGGRRSYEFLGQTIAPDCLASLLGIGKKRLLKAMSGNLDMRFAETGGSIRQSPKTDSVDRFLYELHSSIAETLPSGFLGMSKRLVFIVLFVSVSVHVCLCASKTWHMVSKALSEVFWGARENI